MQTGLILLGLLVTFFRYPITESPTGTDNFYYISAVKAILVHGEIFWAENLLSIYGLFPGTTPLGSLILATHITEVSGLSVHDYHLDTQYFFSLIFTFGIFHFSRRVYNKLQKPLVFSFGILSCSKVFNFYNVEIFVASFSHCHTSFFSVVNFTFNE